MADRSEPISNTSKSTKAPTEKKKRKRPSKKVPTTVLQANNTGFMHLVQKLTGSAEELAAGESSNNSPMTTFQSTVTTDVDHTNSNYNSYGNYSNYSPEAPYSNAPPYNFQNQSFQEQHYQSYQDPAPPPHCGGSSYDVYGGGYGVGGYGPGGYGSGGYGSGAYGSGGYGDSGSRSYGAHEENHTYGYTNTNDSRGSSPSSSRGFNAHEGSPDEFGNHNSSSDYYW